MLKNIGVTGNHKYLHYNCRLHLHLQNCPDSGDLEPERNNSTSKIHEGKGIKELI